MQEVRVIHWCDWPECAEKAQVTAPEAMGQEVQPVEYWVYSSGRGRKTKPIRVELCDTHTALLKHQFSSLQKYNQKDIPGEEPTQ